TVAPSLHDALPIFHFTQTERDFRSFGYHPDLGAGAHCALVARDAKFLAIANKSDGLLGTGRTAGSCSRRRCTRTTRPDPRRPRARACTTGSGSRAKAAATTSGEAAEAAKSATTAGAPKIQASDITRTHRGVPR